MLIQRQKSTVYAQFYFIKLNNNNHNKNETCASVTRLVSDF